MFVDQHFRKQRLKVLKTISSLQIMQTFAPFVFATGSDVCTFSQPAISATDRRIRSRVLTFEDMENIASTGRLTPIALPHGIHPTRDIAQWSRALRLTDQRLRPKFAEFAVAHGGMDVGMLQFCGRNENHNAMPLPEYVSTGGLQMAPYLPYHFAGRLEPLWVGCSKLLLFIDERGEGLADIAHLQQFIYTKFAACMVGELGDLVREWAAQITDWQAHFNESHFRTIEVNKLISENKAVVISFDVGSMRRSGFSVETAMRLYAEMTEMFMGRVKRGDHVTAAAIANSSMVIIAQLEKFVGGLSQQDASMWSHAVEILEAAAMQRMESLAYSMASQSVVTTETV